MRRSYFVCTVFVALLVCWSLSIAETAKEFQDKGETAYKAKDYAKAVECYTEALKFEPNRHDTIYARGVNYYMLKKYDDALADFNRVKDVKKIDHHALNYIGLIHNEKKEYRGALDAFTGAVSLEPKSAAYSLNAARAAVQADSLASAMAYYKKALKIDPSNKEADRYIKARRTALAGMEKSEEESLARADQRERPEKKRSSGPLIECVELGKLIKSELDSPDSFVTTFRAYSATERGERGECKDIDGNYYCFECEESGMQKLVYVWKDSRGKLHFKKYGCPCSKQ
jgi:tetratricopeptide (TPR) repeat protein